MAVQIEERRERRVNGTARYRVIGWALGLFGIIVFAASAFAYWQELGGDGISGKPSDWGTYGDFISGFVGTLISLATLVALALTLHLQAKQLSDTREELRGQREHLAAQAYGVSKQNFENTFFRLLDLIAARSSQLEVPGNTSPEYRGRGALMAHVTSLNAHRNGRLINDQLSKQDAIDVYNSWHAVNAQVIDPYFGLVYQALRVIDSSQMLSKQSYADILWGLLSPAEKHLLFYHGISGLTAEDFAVLLRRYRMFESFELSQVAVIPPARMSWYPTA